jgi:thioredoxin-related protein
MKKYLISFLFLIFVSQTYFCFGQGIKFEKGSWDSITAIAKKKNLKIFVDCYTTWCGPCKSMSSKVFKDTAVANFYNKYFVSCKMDMESKDGIQFNKLFPVEAYPTLMFFDEEGTQLKKIVGYTETKLFLETGKYVAAPELTELYVEKQDYLKGKKDKKFLYLLAEDLHHAEDTMQAPAKDFLALSGKDSLKNDSTFDVFLFGVRDLNNLWVRQFVKHYRYLHEIYPYACEEKKYSLITENVRIAALTENKNLLNEVVAYARKVYSHEEINDIYVEIMKEYNAQVKK